MPLTTHLRRFEKRGVWSGETIAGAARSRAERWPDDPIFIGGEQPYTAARLFTDANALAAGLLELGITPGTVVSFQLPNWPEAAAINVACAMLGAVVMPIVPIYRDAEVSLMLREGRSRVHFTTECFRNYSFADMLSRLEPELSQVKVVYVRGERGVRGYSALLNGGRGRDVTLPEVASSSAKLLLYTSGTTGMPKGVLHSHDTLARCLSSVARHWRLAAGEPFLMPSPVTHITGYGFGLEMPFNAGTATLLMETWDAVTAAQLIDRHGIVGTLSATPFLQELVDAAERAGTRLRSFRIFACGGAPVPPDLIRRANHALAQTCAFRVYGASEVPMITLGYLGPENAELAATTDGEIGDYEVRIVDERDMDVARGISGEILARGPGMFMGYSDADQTRASITEDGFFRTGDLGVVTSQGSLTVTGRKKDLIIRGGENISPKEIEDVLHRHPGIVEAAVVSMPHPRLGEGVCAYIVSKPGYHLDPESVGAHIVANGLARQKCPERIHIVPALPKTASGKVRKDVLRAEVRAVSSP